MFKTEFNKMNSYGQYVVPDSKEMINLGVGQPRTNIFKNIVKSFQDYMREYSETDLSDELLQYGDIPGYYRFRKVLSEFLNKNGYIESKPENFFQTNGVTEAVQILTILLTKKDSLIVVENPTYFLMINIFKELGRQVVGINMNENGFNVSELKSILEKNTDRDILFYGIPFNHNPTGVSWSGDTAWELCQLLDKHENLKVITDEVYQLLNFYEDKNYSPMADYHQRIITMGSFSKVLAPAFRIGWIYSKNMSILEKLKKSASRDSSGGNNVISSLIVEKFIKTNRITEILNSEKKRLRENLNFVKKYLTGTLSEYFDFKLPNGGYFLWLKLKNKYLSYQTDIFYQMEKYKVKFHCGNKFSISKDFGECLRLSLSFYTKEEILEGLERLNNLMKNLTNKKNVGIFGYNGKLGSLICQELKKQKIKFGKIKTLENLKEFDVIIDVTSKKGTKELFYYLNSYQLYPSLIVGTTGHDNLDDFKKYGDNGLVYYVSNFSPGIRMLKEFLRKNSFENYNVLIEETHHIHKKDSPSGTAKSLADSLEMKDIEINSVRVGEVFGDHNIFLRNDNEEIEIKHSAKNRNLFAIGCVDLLLSLELSNKKGFYQV